MLTIKRWIAGNVHYIHLYKVNKEERNLNVSNLPILSLFVLKLHRVAKEDEGKTIKCVVVPLYGPIASVEQTVNPGCK